jgi:hypothetical protein
MDGTRIGQQRLTVHARHVPAPLAAGEQVRPSALAVASQGVRVVVHLQQQTLLEGTHRQDPQDRRSNRMESELEELTPRVAADVETQTPLEELAPDLDTRADSGEPTVQQLVCHGDAPFRHAGVNGRSDRARPQGCVSISSP